MNFRTFKGEIVGLRRLSNSTFGNPKYTVRIRITKGMNYWDVSPKVIKSELVDLQTETDAGFAYAITDSWIGKQARITVRGVTRQRIVDITLDNAKYDQNNGQSQVHQP